jgi:hypothetical protein
MARSSPSAPHAFVSEVARYLAMEPADVKRMIALDKLPAVRIPREKRHVHRIPLRDFHAWLLKLSTAPVPELASYETFLADFDGSARSERAAEVNP